MPGRCGSWLERGGLLRGKNMNIGMSFWEIVGVNMWSMCITTLLLLWCSRMLLGRIPGTGNRGRLAGGILLGLAMSFIWAFLGAVCYLKGVWRWPLGTGLILWEYFQMFIWMLFLKFLYRLSWRRCWASTLLAVFLTSLGNTMSNFLVINRVFDLRVTEELRHYLFWLMVLMPLCIFLFLVPVWRTGLGKLYGKWVIWDGAQGWLYFFLSLYPIFFRLLCWMVQKSQTDPNDNPMVSLLLLLLIHLALISRGREEEQRKQIAQQEISLRQQTVYIEQMEQMQTEIRRFRHDFKNLMAGMYFQAQEGELETLKSFIQDMTADFDRQAGDRIRIMNQLANVQVAEIKGLLLQHMTDMQKDGIRFELEVMRPFSDVAMRRTDLTRCLGILLDNAAEAVQGKKDGMVFVMISSQKDCVTIRVKNTLYEIVDFGRLGSLGYSTKGHGHGIGLSNYRKILEKYDAILSATSVEAGFFVQELKILQGCGT